MLFAGGSTATKLPFGFEELDRPVITFLRKQFQQTGPVFTGSVGFHRQCEASEGWHGPILNPLELFLYYYYYYYYYYGFPKEGSRKRMDEKASLRKSGYTSAHLSPPQPFPSKQNRLLVAQPPALPPARRRKLESR